MVIELTESAKELLIKKGYDPSMGARPMRRCLQNLIEDPISEKIISGGIKPNSKIVVSSENDEIKFKIGRINSSMIKV